MKETSDTSQYSSSSIEGAEHQYDDGSPLFGAISEKPDAAFESFSNYDKLYGSLSKAGAPLYVSEIIVNDDEIF